MQYNSEPVVLNSIIKLGRNHSMKQTHTRNTSFKKTMIFFNWKEAIWSLTKKKKQGDKKENLTESLHLTVKIARRSNYNIDLRKLSVNKITGRRNHKAALNEKPTDSPQYSSFAVQFSIRVAKTRAILLFKIKITLIEMFELNERMPGMRSAEYQATIPLKLKKRSPAWDRPVSHCFR